MNAKHKRTASCIPILVGLSLSCSVLASSTIYNEDFNSDPGYSIREDVGSGVVFWDSSQSNFYARVYDVSSGVAVNAGVSPTFTRITSHDAFSVEFDFNPVQPDWGHYPGIHFVSSEYSDEVDKIENSAINFRIRWCDRHFKTFAFSGYGDHSTIPAENEWYRVKLRYDNNMINWTVRRHDGTIFIQEHNLPFTFQSFDQIVIGERTKPPKYGNTAVIRLDNIIVRLDDNIPSAPQNPSTEYGSTDDSILIYWDAVEGATSYRLYRAKNAFNPQQAQLVADVGSATIYEHSTSGAWVYYVQAINANGASEYSFPVWGASKNTRDDTLSAWTSIAISVAETVATLKKYPLLFVGHFEEILASVLPESISHYYTFPRSPDVVAVASPIDIELHLLSSGVVITKHNAHEHGCVYVEGDLFDNASRSDMLIIYRPIIEEYEIRFIPENGSDGETFTAVFLTDGNMGILYEDEVIDTSNTYHYHEWRRPIVGIESHDDTIVLGWDAISDGLNQKIEYSSDLVTWEVLELEIEESDIHSSAVIENASGSGFYRVVVSSGD